MTTCTCTDLRNTCNTEARGRLEAGQRAPALARNKRAAAGCHSSERGGRLNLLQCVEYMYMYDYHVIWRSRAYM